MTYSMINNNKLVCSISINIVIYNFYNFSFKLFPRLSNIGQQTQIYITVALL